MNLAIYQVDAFTGRLFGAPINDDDRTLHLGVAFSDRNIDVPVDQKGFGLDIAESGGALDVGVVASCFLHDQSRSRCS